MNYFEFDPDELDPDIIRIIKKCGYIAINDPDIVRVFVQEAIESNPKIVAAYRINPAKNEKALGKIIGDVMRRTNLGVEPPDMIGKLLIEQLK